MVSLAIAIISFSQDSKVINDKNAQARSVKGFHGIRVSNGIDLYLSQGKEAVAVSATSPEYRDRIRTEVVDGILKIYLDQEWAHLNWGNRKLKAYVSFTNLDDLQASGGSDVNTEGNIKVNNLNVHLSGGSDLNARIDAGQIAVHQSGGSDVEITGKANNLELHASGGSDFHGYDFVTDVCKVNASGGSDIHLTVNKELTVEASGGSDISYKGSGVIKEVNTSGSSSVSKK
jgi:hypothetical protein